MKTLSPEGYKVQAIVMSDPVLSQDVTVCKMEVGDWFSGDRTCIWNLDDPNPPTGYYKGNLVEIKIGDDFGIHTEQLERFQDECYRMACYRQQNPHVQLHAVWVTKDATSDEQRLFLHYCFKYHIWGHLLIGWERELRLIGLLKELDQDSQYKEFEPYIKRSHAEPTDLARSLRVPQGSSSQTAIDLSNCINTAQVGHVKGMRKKDGSPSKLWQKLHDYLENMMKYYLACFQFLPIELEDGE